MLGEVGGNPCPEVVWLPDLVEDDRGLVTLLPPANCSIASVSMLYARLAEPAEGDDWMAGGDDCFDGEPLMANSVEPGMMIENVL